MNEEQIRLILEVTGTGTIEEAINKLQGMKRAGQEVAQTYEVLGQTYEVAERQVESATDAAVRAAMEQTQAQRALSLALEETSGDMKALETSTVSTHTATGDMGRGILQASYAVQDFTSVLAGGQGLTKALGAVQNNIPVLLTGLGMGSGMAGAISLVSVGVGALIPLLGSLATAENEATKAIDAFNAAAARGESNRRKRALARLDKQIADLEDKEDAEGGLGPADQLNLNRLRQASQAAHQEIDYDEAMAKGAAERSSRQQALDDAKAEAEILANDPDQQYMERHRAAREKRNAAIRQDNEAQARRKRVEKNLDRVTNSAVDAELDAERLAEHTARLEAQAQKAQDRVDAKTEKTAPLRQAEAYVRQTANMMGEPLSAEQVAEAAKETLRAMQANINRDTAAIGAISGVVLRAKQMADKFDQQRMKWMQLGNFGNETRLGY